MDEKLMELYTLAFAPLGTGTLLTEIDDLDADDFTNDVVAEEAQFLQRLNTLGFMKFQNYLCRYTGEGQNAYAEEVAAGLDCFTKFIERMNSLNTTLSVMMSKLRQNCKDGSSKLKILESQAKTNRRPVHVQEFASVLDMTPNAKWDSLVLSPAKVGFHEYTNVIDPRSKQKPTEALKGESIPRKKYRNPTGFQKFNFKDLEELRGIASTTGSSIGEREYSSLDDMPSQWKQRSSGDEGGMAELEQTKRSASFVGFSRFEEKQEITDSLTDPTWDDQQRHVRRFSRIRNRVPTGHPSMMKRSSDELGQLIQEIQKITAQDIEEDEKSEGLIRDDNAFEVTMANTKINQARGGFDVSPKEKNGINSSKKSIGFSIDKT